MASESTNRDYAANNAQFRAACDEQNIPPTKRQAGKWRRKTGAAYLNRTRNIRRLEDERRQIESELYLASQPSTDAETGDEVEPDQGKITGLQNMIVAVNRRINLLKGN